VNHIEKEGKKREEEREIEEQLEKKLKGQIVLEINFAKYLPEMRELFTYYLIAD